MRIMVDGIERDATTEEQAQMAGQMLAAAQLRSIYVTKLTLARRIEAAGAGDVFDAFLAAHPALRRLYAAATEVHHQDSDMLAALTANGLDPYVMLAHDPSASG